MKKLETLGTVHTHTHTHHTFRKCLASFCYAKKSKQGRNTKIYTQMCEKCGKLLSKSNFSRQKEYANWNASMKY